MKTAERVIMVLLLLVIVGSVFWLYFVVSSERAAVRDAVARGEYEIRPGDAATDAIPDDNQTDWRRYYPVTVPITIGDVQMLASVADTLPSRIQGLSGTPYLPEDVVKLFVFESEGTHAIWMKDMNYALDILWADQAGNIVHIEEDISPDTFPDSFGSPVPSLYVIEANAGFVATSGITVGDTLTLVNDS